MVSWILAEDTSLLGHKKDQFVTGGSSQSISVFASVPTGQCIGDHVVPASTGVVREKGLFWA